MKNKYSLCYIIPFIIIESMVQMAYAFEPVGIDDFFKQYPDERPIQPTISPKSNNNMPAAHSQKNKNNNSTNDIIDISIPMTAQTYPEVELLLLDRISGRSAVTKFKTGQTKALNTLFDVTIMGCTERKTEFGYATHTVPMKIVGFANSKADTKKTTLYDDIFYVEIPGFKGFEHPIYDIRPIKCLGTAEAIELNEPIIDTPAETTNNNVTDDTNKEPIKQKNDVVALKNVTTDSDSQNAIENIISNADTSSTGKTTSERPVAAPSPVPLSVPVPVPLPVPLPVPVPAPLPE